MAATGILVNGPSIRLSPGSWQVDKCGNCKCCHFTIDDSPLIELSGHIVLSNHSTIRLVAKEAQELTIRLLRN